MICHIGDAEPCSTVSLPRMACWKQPMQSSRKKYHLLSPCLCGSRGAIVARAKSREASKISAEFEGMISRR